MKLAFAAHCLDGGGFAARLAERLGRSVETIGRNLPSRCAVWRPPR